jgi:hypothetical protein
MQRIYSAFMVISTFSPQNMVTLGVIFNQKISCTNHRRFLWVAKPQNFAIKEKADT